MNSSKDRQSLIVISSTVTYKGLNVEVIYQIWILYAMLSQLRVQYLLNSFKCKLDEFWGTLNSNDFLF